MDKAKTGSIVKEARIRNGYTQQELGEIVGVINKAVSHLENAEQTFLKEPHTTDLSPILPTLKYIKCKKKSN